MSSPTLVLSNDSAIESVLSEVPFFCVGLVAFAVATFFLFMRRITLLSVYLYSSAIFAFSAAILDISQLLARGSANVQQGAGTEAYRAIINTREVGFAISVGFRYLFFWKFVAERPRGEPPPPNLVNPAVYNPREHAHSASWKRWGVIGFLLRWALLAATLSLPILQILWRITFRINGPVYVVESTIEIIVSALFALKILLNVFLSPALPRWKPLISYLVPFIALMFNLAVAIGSLIMFLFSETTLGRFLQGVELYILMLYILVSAFYKIPTRPPRAQHTSYLVSSPEKNPPNYIMPSRTEGRLDEPRRQSSRRLSSWIMARRSSRLPSGVRWLVNEVDVERDAGGNQQNIPDDASGRRLQIRDEMRRVTPSPSSSPAPSIRIEKAEVISSIPGPGQRRNNRLSTGFSLSYYGSTQTRDSGVEFPEPIPFINRSPTRIDSPVYGLNGIVNAEPAPSPVRASQTSLSSLDELLRQQSELDKSIANLRLFSPQATSTNIPSDGRIESSASRPPRTDRTYSSTSNPSEFSLSIFPDPPKFGELEKKLPSSRVSSMALRAKRTTILTDAAADEMPERFLAPRTAGRLDSAGTSYDVTSFIGDLTRPSTTSGHTPSASFNRSAPVLSDVESEDEALGVVTSASTNQPVRPILIGGVSQSPREVEQVDQVPPKEISPVSPTKGLRPLLLGNVTMTPSVSSPLAPRNPDLIPAGPRRMTPKMPQSRLVISNPRLQKETDNGYESTAFERPRRAPAISPS
ncbi:hypothetical protein V5O48_005979 [Marasmius crinis-equi]|uniref:Uncharacterized protein n=1 Tax=Marasmius crinis-equi TaxID=585013 RepID=A0ABR3FKQ9_9AGAR